MIPVLLIDDNPLDIQLAEMAMREAGVDIVLAAHVDPTAALQYLDGIARDAVPRPGAVLLDIALPRVTGFEILGRIKRDEKLRNIPVFMFSSSHAAGDVARAEELDAAGYIAKPDDFPGFLEFAKRLAGWLHGDCC